MSGSEESAWNAGKGYPVAEANAITEAEAQFTVYGNYVRSFVVDASELSDLLKAQTKLRSFAKLQRDWRGDTTRVRRMYQRGALTYTAMAKLPVDTHPELAIPAIFWLPVQAYYAVHGVGLAALAVLQGTTPDSHTKFLRAAGDQLAQRLLPPPFELRCTGDPESRTTETKFTDKSLSERMIRDLSPLSKVSSRNARAYIGKCLMTTRERLIERVFDEHRQKGVQPGKSRRNLKANEKGRLVNRIHETSVFDFFYRMRVRSNYHDPEMYLAGPDDLDAARDFATDITTLTKIILCLLDNIIQQKVHQVDYNTIKGK